MTRDELETTILNAKALDSIERESNEWFAKYHDKNFFSKGLKPGEYTHSSIREEISLAKSLKAAYLQLNPLPINAFMNESALKALLAFFEGKAGGSAGSEAALWSFHASALREAMLSRGIQVEEAKSFFV